MSDYITVTPTPAVTTAYRIVEAIRAEGQDVSEGISLIAVAHVLMALERSGKLVFTEAEQSYKEDAARFEAALKEFLEAVSDDGELCDCIYSNSVAPTLVRGGTSAQRERVRRAISLTESVLGY